AALQGLLVDLGDGRQQSADLPLTVSVPDRATGIPVSVRRRDSQTTLVEATVPVREGPPSAPITNAATASGFTTSPVWQNTGVINGPLSGDAQRVTHVTIDGQPARILTETSRRCHLDTASIPAGPHAIVVEEGPRRTFFPVVAKASVVL